MKAQSHDSSALNVVVENNPNTNRGVGECYLINKIIFLFTMNSKGSKFLKIGKLIH